MTGFSMGNAGLLGDSFGLLAAFFSGLAFIGMIVALLMQRQELSLQRTELQLTREEFVNQNDVLRRQVFENTFFQMLRLHHDIVRDIDLSRTAAGAGVVVTSGRDCLLTFYKRLSGTCAEARGKSPGDTEGTILGRSYDAFWKKHRHELGHYFRNLYTIFKFVHKSDMSNKRHYTSVVTAQLSEQELALVFYDCLCRHGQDKFKPLAEKYALFDSLPKSILLDAAHADHYALSAFGE